ncbi:MAG: flagellar hook assembly protein FlgD [Betaproteobacteria bacterium]|jgi:flagellar basal-body rod modification protein FlgD
MASTVTTSSNFLSNLPKYEEIKKASANPTAKEEMGQQAFLTLFTTQLQNQDPLDPVKNEAFVAQLAQFSQLEATTKMSESMASVAASLQSDRLMAGTALIGKKVAAPNGSAQLIDGRNISGVIEVPNGADKVTLDVFDQNGVKVFTQALGRQAPGDVSLTWEGYNQKGDRMPAGLYKVLATVDSFGKVTQIPISTPTVVRSVSYNSGTKEMMIEVEGGGSMPLSQVKRVDG